MNRSAALRLFGIAIATALTIGGLSACSAQRVPATTTVSEIFSDYRKVNGGPLSYYPDASLREVLPNQLYSYKGGQPRTVVDGISVGYVSNVVAGEAYAFDDDESHVAILDHFDDPAADWKVVVATIRLKEGFGLIEDATDLKVGVTLYGGQTLEEASRSLEGLGTLFVPVVHNGFYSFDHDVWFIYRDGATLGVLDGERITFPAMAPGEAREYIGDLKTLDDVRAASRVSDVPVKELLLDVGKKHDG